MTSHDPRWAQHKLAIPAGEYNLLRCRDGKTDAADASQLHVRAGRFTNSFMMGTNGGATYETLLRPAPRGLAQPEGDIQPAPLPSGALHNVFGHDDRRLVQDTSQIPARSIGLLKIFMESGSIRYGTAWLIGPRVLATAGHNLVHPDAGRTARLEVGLAYDGTSPRGGWHKVIDNRLPQAWLDEPSTENPNDFAVLQIADPEVGNRLGWFGFADYEDAKFPNMLLNLFGYPMDQKLKRFCMYGTTGRVLGVDEHRIYFDCDASGGMSGGPVIARFGEQRIAVGIHVAGGETGNAATRLTANAYELFKAHESW